MIRNESASVVHALDTIFVTDRGQVACPLTPLSRTRFLKWRDAQSGIIRAWVDNSRFAARPNEVLTLPDSAGGVTQVLLGLGDTPAPFALAAVPPCVPEQLTYRLASETPTPVCEHAAFAWGLAQYKFDRYLYKDTDNQSTSSPSCVSPGLIVPHDFDIARTLRLLRAVFVARDLINTPAADMGPDTLATTAEMLAARHGASCRIICGDALLEQNYPLIHAVGRAASVPPRLIDIAWGDEAHRKVTLVGKGVCFDTGGLNLKPGEQMGLMKKDMGGAAVALALAGALMEAQLPIRLRVLIGACENAIGAGAFRPGDILPSRKGMSVEIGNTDAEGRLVLADLLADAADDVPDLLLDFATLTGAARIALGPDLVPFYTNRSELGAMLMAAGDAECDPLWPMPLWEPYRDWLETSRADICHISQSSMAGSIVAALFLQNFVPSELTWVHFDIYGWNNIATPGHPIGAAAQALRACYRLIEEYGGE